VSDVDANGPTEAIHCSIGNYRRGDAIQETPVAPHLGSASSPRKCPQMRNHCIGLGEESDAVAEFPRDAAARLPMAVNELEP